LQKTTFICNKFLIHENCKVETISLSKQRRVTRILYTFCSLNGMNITTFVRVWTWVCVFCGMHVSFLKTYTTKLLQCKYYTHTHTTLIRFTTDLPASQHKLACVCCTSALFYKFIKDTKRSSSICVKECVSIKHAFCNNEM
jgi:hypothetical protein